MRSEPEPPQLESERIESGVEGPPFIGENAATRQVVDVDG